MPPRNIRFCYAWFSNIFTFLIAYVSFKFASSCAVGSLLDFNIRIEKAILILQAVNLAGSISLSFFIYRWSVRKYILPQLTNSSDMRSPQEAP